MLRKAKDKIKEALGRILCLFGFHVWKARLTRKGRVFFASIGIDTVYNTYCLRPNCDKVRRSA